MIDFDNFHKIILIYFFQNFIQGVPIKSQKSQISTEAISSALKEPERKRKCLKTNDEKDCINLLTKVPKRY